MTNPPYPKSGKLILLSGTPATGKTTIAKELIKLMGMINLRHFDFDEFGKNWPGDLDTRFFECFPSAVVQVLDQGNAVFDPWLPDEYMQPILDAVPGSDRYAVRVNCSDLDELDRREASRNAQVSSDEQRPVGSARERASYQTGLSYDCRIDTAGANPNELAKAVKDAALQKWGL